MAAETRSEADVPCTDQASPARVPTRRSCRTTHPDHGRPGHSVSHRGGLTVKLSILMAAYNEAETITQAAEEVLGVAYPCDMELIVIDDGSTDGTADLLAGIDDPRLTVLRHDTNRGKGAAVLTGAASATGTHILPFDADLEYMPEDILRLIEPVLRGRCTVVYGARLFGCNTMYRSYLYAMGNRLFTRTANLLFGAYLTDLHTCLKLIPVDVLRRLDLRETGFGLDTEISASLLRCGIRPFEVPVTYFSRSHDEGKKITWRDGFACLWILLRVRVAPASRFPKASEISIWAARVRSISSRSEQSQQLPMTRYVVAEQPGELNGAAPLQLPATVVAEPTTELNGAPR